MDDSINSIETEWKSVVGRDELAFTQWTTHKILDKSNIWTTDFLIQISIAMYRPCLCIFDYVEIISIALLFARFRNRTNFSYSI